MDDKILQCVDCKNDFTYTAKDQEFFHKMKFNDPKRCKSCRQVKKEKDGR